MNWLKLPMPGDNKMVFPHILTYLGRKLHVLDNKLTSFTPEEETDLKKIGLYCDVYLPKMTPSYKQRALQLMQEVKKIDYEAQTSDFYRAQMKVDALVKSFNREFGLEKRLAGQAS